MKNLILFFCFTYFISAFQTINAQDSANNINDLLELSIHENAEVQLNNIDSIPDFQTKENKLKLTGTIYHADGVTPAKDVVLYIYQPNEDGNYEMIEENDVRRVHHSASIKTDADGKYTFYTFIPGTVHRSGDLRHIHPVIKVLDAIEYDLNNFYFDNDPLLTKFRRKRLIKKGRGASILKLEKKEDFFVTNRDIILGQDMSSCK
ncbi:hypothetical protein ACFS5M_07680 [Lacinutrix iliipiscaria]|uniref:Intradiol ring-cleavage dioxygenases domain-containing protein n=1 Tax=Lacinutrix iliipiscaria TaxID=1230532 RepID=A0ABW5WNM5_9FLAO